MPKEVVVDARAHMLGRLASVVAKQALSGYHVVRFTTPARSHLRRALVSDGGRPGGQTFARQVVVRCEDINISGGIVRQKMKYERFLRKGTNTNPTHGQFHFRAPSQILRRTIRGMVPHKTARGAAALERVKCFEGVPPPYDKRKRMVVPDCLKVMCLQHGHRYCRLGDLSAQVGWKHEKAVATLEEKRKAKAMQYYSTKKKLIAMRKKAEAQVA